jgi:hypothetical protein
MRLAGVLAYIGEINNVQKISVGTTEGKKIPRENYA